MQPAQLNKYYYNTITRLDCEIGDLLEFVPPEDADSQ